MNAPATAAAVAPAAKLEFIPLIRIKPSTTHIQALRRARFDKKALEELAASIRKVGILQPIVARPRADGFEIVAGERRFLAAKLAGADTIAVNVSPLTDDQVLEVQLIENLQREGLHELEEAEGYEELMKLKKINADIVADMVGKSRSYVYARTKLLALCPEARKAFYAGELDASRALLVARIGHHDTQRAAVLDITKGEKRWQGRRDGEPMSYRDAHRHILQTYMLKLKVAPFDIADATLLPKAGACGPCPKRTGNQRDLFGDVKDADVCTDPKCFDDKRQAHHAGARRKLELAGEKVIAGDAAKKIFTCWDARDSYSRDQMEGGYVPLDGTTYASGRSRKVGELLGDDYKPVLIQHPGTGKIIKAATQQAVAKVSQSPVRSRPARLSAQAKPKGPDVDEEEFKALLKLIHEKAPKKFGRQHLRAIAKRLFQVVNPRRYGLEAMKAAWKWPSLQHSHYKLGLPKEAAALDERGLHLFMLDTLFVGCYSMERKPLLDLFGISEKKVREQVIADRKKAQVAARVAKVNAAIEKREAKAKVGAKNKAKPHSWMKLLTPKPALAAIVGTAPLARTEITKKVWSYIKRNGLQDKKTPRIINADTKLQAVFGGKKKASMFEMTKLIGTQLTA